MKFKFIGLPISQPTAVDYHAITPSALIDERCNMFLTIRLYVYLWYVYMSSIFK